MNTPQRLVVVSNRLPLVLEEQDSGWQALPASGGLVTALKPVLRQRDGIWVGWPGTQIQDGVNEAISVAAESSGFDLKPVALDQNCIEGFYYGFANEVLWPLFHGFETRCNFEPTYWNDYVSANQQFVETIVDTLEPDDFLWVHDYHLMLVAREIKREHPETNCTFFLHIPFPSPDVFFKLPWRKEILEGLLAFDLIGFQTLRDRRNFISCLRHLQLPGLKIRGRGAIVEITLGRRNIRAGAFPISLDYEEIQAVVSSKQVAEEAWLFHERFPDRKIMIGIDRLDYTKGIPERLRAYELSLERYPELRGNISMVQLTVPSREQVPEYERLRTEIEQLVGKINGRYTQLGGWVPIHYLHRSVDRTTVLAYLRAAEIGIVTPLRDGMNLVAKEYVACNIDSSGVLILSEFAGVAAEFKRRCLLVNPYDIEGMAVSIRQAFKMDLHERKRRMIKLRRIVRQHNIFHWVESFIRAASSTIYTDDIKADEFIPDFKIEDH